MPAAAAAAEAVLNQDQKRSDTAATMLSNYGVLCPKQVHCQPSSSDAPNMQICHLTSNEEAKHECAAVLGQCTEDLCSVHCQTHVQDITNRILLHRTSNEEAQHECAAVLGQCTEAHLLVHVRHAL
jgi:hypothetical protein